jgi:hypothetical protein
MTMPVDIAVTTASGTNTYVVWCINMRNTFVIPIDGTPTQVALDPDDWILTHSVSTFTQPIAPLFCQGDLDEDGLLNALDMQAFVQVLLDSGTWPAGWLRSDMDFDGRCDLNDLPLFIDALLEGCNLP